MASSDRAKLPLSHARCSDLKVQSLTGLKLWKVANT